MERIYVVLFIVVSFICNAQVGIGTVTPAQALHIAGENSTIRVEKLNVSNSPLYNNGIKPAPTFVDAQGNVSIYGGIGSGIQPINFLINVPNFLPDNPYGHITPYDQTGIAINNNASGEFMVEQLIDNNVTFTVPQQSLIEVKYGITLYVRGSDISASPPFLEPTYSKTVTMLTYFCVDINNDGLSPEESNKKYGIKGQYYESEFGGAPGHPYMNGQGYITLPSGTHSLYFFGRVTDASNSYTSVGFGGAEDYLKIRIYQ